MAGFLSFEREAYFPNLDRAGYRVTSDECFDYNCIAHAASRSDAWWWPDEGDGIYWPESVAKDETLDCFIQAYGTEGYEPCESPDLEPGVEKVAIYVDADGVPTHAARQVPSGGWTSKLGDWEDIEHTTLAALERQDGKGEGYGTVAKILKRLAPTKR